MEATGNTHKQVIGISFDVSAGIGNTVVVFYTRNGIFYLDSIQTKRTLCCLCVPSGSVFLFLLGPLFILLLSRLFKILSGVNSWEKD